MMNDIEFARSVSIKSGLPLQFVIKEYAVFEVLGQIAEFLKGRRDVAFKGGTALNKVYLKGVQRFSEDLDFDVEGENTKDAILICNELRGNISGFEISRTFKVGNGAQFYCKYQTPLGGKDNVRVDFTAKKMITLKPLQMLGAKSDYCQLSASGFYVYSLDDLVARKLCAMKNRGEGKDFFDVFQSAGKCGDLKGALEKVILSENEKIGVGGFIDRCIEAAKNADAKKLMKKTNPYIPASLRPADWRQVLDEVALRMERIK